MKKLLVLAGVGAASYAAVRFAMRRRFRLEGRVVAITGGGRGLGLALAREYARRGARVAICGRSDAELEEARRELAAAGADCHAHACDISRTEEARGWIEAVQRELGDVDVLVNNAGVIQVGPVETLTREDFDQAMAVHLFGPLELMRAVLPHMRRRRSGRIVNITSFGGLMGVPHLAAYCASKFALTGLSESMRTELAREGVFVSTICPWLMRTGSARHAHYKGKVAGERLWFNAGAVFPMVTMHPDRAARRIVNASTRGRAELILTPQGKAIIRLKALFPGLMLGLTSTAAGLLPGADGEGRRAVEGTDVELPRAARLVEWLNRRAGARLNEYVD